MAIFDGWCIAIFGGLTVLTGLSSLPSLMLGCGMCLVAHFEFRGASQLRRLDPGALHRLMRNQLALGSMLLLYGLWNFITALTHPTPLADAASHPDVANMLQPFEDLSRLISGTVYATIMLVAVFVQGGTALFYHRRARHLASYLSQTPPWILEMQRNGLGL